MNDKLKIQDMPSLQEMMEGQVLDLLENKKGEDVLMLLSKAFMAGAASFKALLAVIQQNGGDSKEEAIAAFIKLSAETDSYCTVSLLAVPIDASVPILPPSPTVQ